MEILYLVDQVQRLLTIKNDADIDGNLELGGIIDVEDTASTTETRSISNNTSIDDTINNTILGDFTSGARLYQGQQMVQQLLVKTV